MRAGAHRCAGVWQAMAAETVFVPDGIEVLFRAAYAVQRAACTAAPLQSRVYALAALCARSERQAALCVRQSVQQSVQGSWQVCAETEGRSWSCCRADQETPRLRPHTEATARGASAQRHRSASLVGRSRIQRGIAATHRGILEVLPWSRCCVPMRKSYNNRWRAAHRLPPSTTLRCMLSSKSLKGNAPEAAHRGAPGAGSGRSACRRSAGPRRRLTALSTAGTASDAGGAQHASPSAPGLRSPSAARGHSTAH